MAKAASSETANGSREENASKPRGRAGLRQTRLKYLVSGNREGSRENLARVTVAAALRKARLLLQQGYLDVRICTPRGQVLLSDEFNHLEKQEETDMGKGEKRGNRENQEAEEGTRSRSLPAAPSQKAGNWQPNFAPGKKK